MVNAWRAMSSAMAMPIEKCLLRWLCEGHVRTGPNATGRRQRWPPLFDSTFWETRNHRGPTISA
jgi:hypothetical protein